MTLGYSVFSPSAWPDWSLKKPQLTINQRGYNVWRKQCIFDMLKGRSMGESFCNYFCTTDYLLMYQKRSAAWTEKYIKKTYVA
jgi:hypothetical protein